MAGDNKHKHKHKHGSNHDEGSRSKSPAAAVDAAVAGTDENSTDPIGTLLVERIVGFLDRGPSDFAITLLPDPEPAAVDARDASSSSSSSSIGECDGDGDGDVQRTNDRESAPLSSEDRSLLHTSTILMQEPSSNASATRGGHLGLDARHLPRIARILRKAYFRAKERLRTAAAAAAAAASSSSSPSSSPSSPPSSPSPSTIPPRTETEELFHTTSCLLLIQPDHATAWADRRRCLLSLQYYDAKSSNPLVSACKATNGRDSDSIDDGDGDGDNNDHTTDQQATASLLLWNKELDYLDLLVTQHSKAPSYWAHRKHVLRHLMHHTQKAYQCHGVLDRLNNTQEMLFSREVKTCTDVAEKFPKNYYAWTHRRCLWDLLGLDRIDFDFDFDFDFGDAGIERRRCDDGGQQREREWESQQKRQRQQQQQQQQQKLHLQLLETELLGRMWQEWLPRHPADHSAVHYSCQILDSLLKTTTTQTLRPGDEREHEREHEHDQEAASIEIESICNAAVETVRSLLSKYSCENYESLWILRRLTCKILWKNLVCTGNPTLETETATTSLATNLRVRVRRLVKDDLVRTLSSSLGVDVPTLQQLGQDGALQRSPGEPESNNIHAWTFLAWCLANLDGIDDDDNGDKAQLYTPWLRKSVWDHITVSSVPTATKQHNARMYTSPSSPFAELLTTATL